MKLLKSVFWNISLLLFLGAGTLLLPGSPCFAERGLARIRGLEEGSTLTGRAIFTENVNGLSVKVSLFNAPPGLHGFHIHQYGECQGGGKFAGGHFNPQEAPHGFLYKDGMRNAHAGDLGNIKVEQDGTASLEITFPNLTLTAGELSIAGRSVVLHEKEDDFSQPSGNAGKRIACGTIFIVED